MEGSPRLWIQAPTMKVPSEAAESLDLVEKTQACLNFDQGASEGQFGAMR